MAAALVVAAPLAYAADDDDDALVQALLGGGASSASRAESSGDPVLAKPHAAAKPSAYFIHWDRYRSLVVIDSSAGLLRPAWVVTFATAAEQVDTLKGKVAIDKDEVVVAYRAQAFLDKQGVLHVDAHKSVIGGVFADGGGWSPDSFEIGADLMVTTHDDEPRHPGNNGEVEKTVLPAQPGGEYRRLLLIAQAIVEGNI